MYIKLDHTILACALHPLLTCVPYLAGTLRWHLRPPRRLSWRFSTPSPRIQWVLLRRPIQARGRSIPLSYNFTPTLLSCSLERCCLILCTLLCHVSNPYSHDPHIP